MYDQSQPSFTQHPSADSETQRMSDLSAALHAELNPRLERAPHCHGHGMFILATHPDGHGHGHGHHILFQPPKKINMPWQKITEILYYCIIQFWERDH